MIVVDHSAVLDVRDISWNFSALRASECNAGSGSDMASIEEIEGIGPAFAGRFRGAGIRTCEALLAAGADPAGRRRLAEATGFSASTILDWVNRADLMRVRGVGSEYSDLLEASGVDTVKELRQRNAVNLTATMVDVNDDAIARTAKSIVRRVPAISMVEKWIAHAGELEPIVTH